MYHFKIYKLSWKDLLNGVFFFYSELALFLQKNQHWYANWPKKFQVYFHFSMHGHWPYLQCSQSTVAR